MTTQRAVAKRSDGVRDATSLWRPLRTPMFRRLLIADVVSDIGTFMQAVGSAWLMVSIGASPLFVALTQTASTLPFFLFALPAGDYRRSSKLILYTERGCCASRSRLRSRRSAGS